MIKFTVIHHNGRAHTVTATSNVHGGPLLFDRPIPVRAAAGITPATKEDAEELIAHLQETIRLMTLPEKGEKKDVKDRNSKMIEQYKAEKEKD